MGVGEVATIDLGSSRSLFTWDISEAVAADVQRRLENPAGWILLARNGLYECDAAAGWERVWDSSELCVFGTSGDL
jgi:hypothetical protein